MSIFGFILWNMCWLCWFTRSQFAPGSLSWHMFNWSLCKKTILAGEILNSTLWRAVSKIHCVTFMNLCWSGQINSFQSSQHLFKNHSPTGHRVALFGVGNILERALTLIGWLGRVSIETAGHVGVGSFGASPVRALTNLSQKKTVPNTTKYRPVSP